MKARTIRFVPIAIFLAISIALAGTSFLLINSHVYAKAPTILAMGFAIDFVLTFLVAFYFFVARPNWLNPISAVPVLGLALLLSYQALPNSDPSAGGTIAIITVGFDLLFLLYLFWTARNVIVHKEPISRAPKDSILRWLGIPLLVLSVLQFMGLFPVLSRELPPFAWVLHLIVSIGSTAWIYKNYRSTTNLSQ